MALILLPAAPLILAGGAIAGSVGGKKFTEWLKRIPLRKAEQRYRDAGKKRSEAHRKTQQMASFQFEQRMTTAQADLSSRASELESNLQNIKSEHEDKLNGCLSDSAIFANDLATRSLNAIRSDRMAAEDGLSAISILDRLFSIERHVVVAIERRRIVRARERELSRTICRVRKDRGLEYGTRSELMMNACLYVGCAENEVRSWLSQLRMHVDDGRAAVLLEAKAANQELLAFRDQYVENLNALSGYLAKRLKEEDRPYEKLVQAAVAALKYERRAAGERI